MATPAKKKAKKVVKKTTAKKRVTSATVKADIKKKGYRLPHGYDVVKRKPATTKKRTSKKK